jgi:hypothetical protein
MFRPFNITKPVAKEYKRQQERLLENFDDLELPPNLSGETKGRLKEIENRMKQIPLGQNFYDFIDVNDYISSVPVASGERQLANLPQTPMPSSQVVQPQPMMTADGLTPTENALLTEGEKQIRLKQRGMA